MKDIIIEFLYRWPDGREEVRYRRGQGTTEAERMKRSIDELAEKLGTKEEPFPYFYREVSVDIGPTECKRNSQWPGS